MHLLDVLWEAQLHIAGFALVLSTAQNFSQVSRQCAALVRDPRVWADRDFNLTNWSYNTSALCGMGAILAAARSVTVHVRQVPCALTWNRAFTVVWDWLEPYRAARGVVLSYHNRYSLTSCSAPWHLSLTLRWAGPLLGFRVGLTSATTIWEHSSNCRLPPRSARHVAVAMGIMVNGALPATLPRWTANEERIGTASVFDAQPYIHPTSIRSLNLSIQWSQTHCAVLVDGNVVDILHFGHVASHPPLHPQSRLVISWVWPLYHYVVMPLEPRAMTTTMHLPRPRRLPLPCGLCLSENSVLEVCPFCNHGYCEQHGGTCSECSFNGCWACLAVHFHARRRPEMLVHAVL